MPRLKKGQVEKSGCLEKVSRTPGHQRDKGAYAALENATVICLALEREPSN